MDRDLLRLRARWLAELSQLTDAFLRSPAFLKLMRYGFMSMTASIHAITLVAPWCFPAGSRARGDARTDRSDPNA